MNGKITVSQLEATLQDIVDGQQKKVLSCARRIIPTLTTDDVLQPNDYPELENHPEFRYEEGALEVAITAVTARRRIKTEGNLPDNNKR